MNKLSIPDTASLKISTHNEHTGQLTITKNVDKLTQTTSSESSFLRTSVRSPGHTRRHTWTPKTWIQVWELSETKCLFYAHARSRRGPARCRLWLSKHIATKGLTRTYSGCKQMSRRSRGRGFWQGWKSKVHFRFPSELTPKIIDSNDNWLTEGPWLLVLDNALSEDSIKPYIPEQTTAGSLIITTNSYSSRSMWRAEFNIFASPFDSMEGAGLLLDSLNVRERFEKHRLEDSFRDDARISELLKNIPFAIVLAADITKRSKCTLSTFERRVLDKRLPTPFEMVLGIVLRDCKPECRNLLDCVLFMNTYEIQVDIIFREHEHPSLKFLGFADSTRSVFSFFICILFSDLLIVFIR